MAFGIVGIHSRPNGGRFFSMILGVQKASDPSYPQRCVPSGLATIPAEPAGNHYNQFTTDFDTAINELRYLIEHPTESLHRTHEQQWRVEWEKRLNELKDFALSLKEESAGGEAKPQ